MGCAGEKSSRDSYYAVITGVIDITKARAMVDKFSGRPGLEKFVQTIKKGLKKADPLGFSVSIETRQRGIAGTTSIPSTIFPQTQEWAKARIGKRIHVTITRMAKRLGGGLTMDVHDPSE